MILCILYKIESMTKKKNKILHRALTWLAYRTYSRSGYPKVVRNGQRMGNDKK